MTVRLLDLTVVSGFALSLASLTPAPAAAQQYDVVHLGALAPPVSSPNAINNRNHVVGISSVPGGSGLFHAVLWQHGTLIDLGTLPGGELSDARDINDWGQIVGLALDETFTSHAVIWEHGVIRDLGGPPGTLNCRASGINNRGEIVGSCERDGVNEAVLWRNGRIRVLETLPTAVSSVAIDINDWGVVAAVAVDAANVTRAYRWENGRVSLLGLPPGASNSVPNRIDVWGRIAGYSYEPGNPPRFQATLWTKDRVEVLGTLPGAVDSTATALNAFGQVVGTTFDRAWIWSGGVMRELPTPAGRTGAAAQAINDRGVVAGSAGVPEGGSYAVLWVPRRSGPGAGVP